MVQNEVTATLSTPPSIMSSMRRQANSCTAVQDPVCPPDRPPIRLPAGPPARVTACLLARPPARLS